MPLQRNQQRLLRSFALLWARLGTARVYLAIALGILVGLAFLGVWQIVSWAKQVSPSGGSESPVTAVQPVTKPVETAATPKAASPAEKSDTSIASLSPAAPISSPTVTPGHPSINQPNREVEITGINETKRRGRRGETFVEAKVGLASRSDIEKGNVEIRILFFDVTRNNEIVPTDAQVTYRWLTPVRDWSDPTPKYLAATYLQLPMRNRFFERLRYGGVLVRVYAHGKLQDERSEPEGLLDRLQRNGLEEPNLDTEADVPRPPRAARSPIEKDEATPPNTTKLPTPSPPTEKKGSASSSLPYGKPVPGKPGFVSSPYDPKFIIDVRGFPPGTLVNDPNTNKPFRVP